MARVNAPALSSSERSDVLGLMRRPRVQRALSWLGYWLEPHVPVRKQTQVTITQSHLYAEAGETQPLISINGDRR